jgi:hypothetical protein
MKEIVSYENQAVKDFSFQDFAYDYSLRKDYHREPSQYYSLLSIC